MLAFFVFGLLTRGCRVEVDVSIEGSVVLLRFLGGSSVKPSMEPRRASSSAAGKRRETLYIVYYAYAVPWVS